MSRWFSNTTSVSNSGVPRGTSLHDWTRASGVCSCSRKASCSALSALQPGEHRLLRRHVRAERERVDEEADHVVGALDRRLTARARHAEEHVVLARVAAEEQRPGAGHQRPDRAAGFAREGVQPLGFVGRQRQFDRADPFPASRRHRRQQRCRRGQPRETPAPERLRRVGVLRSQPVDVRAVLARRGQAPVAPVSTGVVQPEDLAQQNGKRSTVENRVVERPEHLVVRRPAHRDRQPHQRRAIQVEARRAIGRHERRQALTLLVRRPRAASR